MKTNLLPYSNVMYDIAERIKRDLIGSMAEAGLLYVNLQSYHTNADPIYAIKYDEENGEYREVEVVALRIFLTDDGKSCLYLLTQPNYHSVKVNWSMEDIVDSWNKSVNGKNGDDAEWDELFGGDLAGVFTAYNLADALDYIEM